MENWRALLLDGLLFMDSHEVSGQREAALTSSDFMAQLLLKAPWSPKN